MTLVQLELVTAFGARKFVEVNTDHVATVTAAPDLGVLVTLAVKRRVEGFFCDSYEPIVYRVTYDSAEKLVGRPIQPNSSLRW